MSIHVTGIDSRGHFVHSYANATTVTVQENGTLVVFARTTGSGPSSPRPLGAYPAGKWTNAYDPAEMTDESE
ncbi:hypothetical protein QT969_13120 [Rhodococcus sp. CSLK01-03]|uniref:Uncharacterized protein n=1 Tax=Rhodococcus indonesiensis TaxID=3055869 RepID=A0ABT7RNM1_9NOCA|nr:hypothetical protein [Rhodococcus indonesiensis]MDM7489227.1 hypothetical protein [Rhodococcus indonesiensis]